MTTYRNPIARAGDFADPFVLRHDGVYYLYCTNPDVRCWTSTDLVEWTLVGPTIEADAFPGLVPFAPEVVYADGFFYMYTSPSGHGHFVLRADAPTGPFRPISGNVGHAIDGNVFIDDDGQWYFYWAGDEGIWGCAMSSPTEFGDPVFTGIHMNGWTEGPFVGKRDGAYWMTLTGNHYLSSGYRIDAASSDHPLHGYQPDPLNPIVVGADGPAVGLGHSSTVTGPDLVSTYLIYHNINPDASRDLDIDRQVCSGRRLQVLGPTTSAPVPAHADSEWHADADAPPTSAAFTAELNLTGAGSYGLSVGAIDLRVDADTLTALGAGVVLDSRALPTGFAPDALHCWRLVYDRGELRVFLDGRAQFAVTVDVPSGSRIATNGDVRLGHCAMTDAVDTTADRLAPKPVPGRFWAALGEGALEPLAMSYDLHVQRPGPCTVYLAGAFTAGDVLAVTLDGEPHEVRVAHTGRLVSLPLELAGHSRDLTIRGVDCAPTLELVTVAERPDGVTDTFSNERQSGTGKRMLGTARWDDFVLSATVSFTLDSPSAHADLILRGSQFSEGGEGADTSLGINFLLGYTLQLHRDRVVLARHDYDERVLAAFAVTLDQGRAHTLRVGAQGSWLTVEVDGVEAIRFDDELAYPIGRVGIRTRDSDLLVESLTIERQ